MARLKLNMPAAYDYETRIDIRISDINLGNHVGHDAFVSILHEARVRYLVHLGYSEDNIEGLPIIVSDLAIVYVSQAFKGDCLNVEMVFEDFNRYGCDLFYRVSRVKDTALILEGKTGIVFFNYLKATVSAIPEAFLARVRK